MENINIIHTKTGRKVRRGFIDMIGGYSFAIFPDKAKRTVYICIPGAHEDFLQVSTEPWAVGDEPVEAALERLYKRLEDSNPATWVEVFSSRALEEVRAKRVSFHKEYVLGLLAEYEAFQGKKWKPEA